MLSVLAHKMIHTEDNDGDYIYEVDASKLFKQVKALKIPFHRWYIWLESKFAQLKEVKQLEQKAKEQELERWEQEQEQKLKLEPARQNSAFGIFDKIYKYINRDVEAD